MAAYLSPPCSSKVSPPRLAIPSSVSRQSAEKPGMITAMRLVPLLARSIRVSSK